MERKVTEVTFNECRNMRYGEFFLVKPGAIEVYNTTYLNDCPADKWNALDLEKLAQQFGVVKVILNGPQYWMMDSQTVSLGETLSFGGIDARWVASLNPALAKESPPYTDFMPKKTQKMVYSTGKLVYELVNPDGKSYVLQARKERVPMESLATLGEQLKQLPVGWQYRTRILNQDLVMNLGPEQTIHAVGDEFHQYYTRIPE